MFAAFIALTLAIPVEPPKELPEAAQKELKKLQGKWKPIAVAWQGKEAKADADDDKGGLVEFKARKFILIEDDEALDYYEIVAIDPGTDPKVIDLKSLVEAGPLRKGTVYDAIYKFDGDTLTIAMYYGDGKKRPEKFESTKDNKVIVVTMKREKK